MATSTITINVESLFNLVNQRTLYIANHIDLAINEAMIDKIPITQDEYDAFIVFIRQGATEVFKALSRLSVGITDPFTYTIPDGETLPTEIIYLIALNDNSQADIVLPILTDHIVRALVAYIVMQWLKMRGVETKQFVVDEVDYNYCMKEIRSMKDYGVKPRVKNRYF